jgi:hypothetical protein
MLARARNSLSRFDVDQAVYIIAANKYVALSTAAARDGRRVAFILDWTHSPDAIPDGQASSGRSGSSFHQSRSDTYSSRKVRLPINTPRRKDMSRLIAGLIVALSLVSGTAFAFDLSGAWASDRGVCSKIFSKKGSAVSFAEMSDLYGSGFIVNGDVIQGKSAKCNIKSRKQNGDTTTLVAICSTTITTDDYQFVYKTVDDNTLDRVLPDMDNVTIRFSRCST